MAGMGGERKHTRKLMGRPKENTPLGRPKRRRDGLGWIDLAEDRKRGRAVVNAAMNRRDP